MHFVFFPLSFINPLVWPDISSISMYIILKKLPFNNLNKTYLHILIHLQNLKFLFHVFFLQNINLHILHHLANFLLLFHVAYHFPTISNIKITYIAFISISVHMYISSFSICFIIFPFSIINVSICMG